MAQEINRTVNSSKDTLTYTWQQVTSQEGIYNTNTNGLYLITFHHPSIVTFVYNFGSEYFEPADPNEWENLRFTKAMGSFILDVKVQ